MSVITHLVDDAQGWVDCGPCLAAHALKLRQRAEVSA
jgi:hypothetical protein